MDRRDVLTIVASAGFLPGALRSRREPPAPDAPPLDVEVVSRDVWRIRSWDWTDGAWRPHIAHAVRDAGALTITGRVAQAQRGAVDACMSRLARA